MTKRIEYNTDFQKLMIQLLISDNNLFALSRNIINPDYWDPEFQRSVEFIVEYADEYKNVPTPNIIHAETRKSYDIINNITPDISEWFLDNIENFCRHKDMEKLIYDGPELLDKGDYGTIETRVKESVMISLQKDLGLDYFADPKSRIEKVKDKSNMVSSGWTAIDKALYGGLSRGEITFFAGGPGCVTGDTKVRILRSRKIVEVEISSLYNNTYHIYVDSPDGWVEVLDCVKKEPKEILTVTTENGLSVNASIDHLFQDEHGTWLYAKDLTLDDRLITKAGISKISNISKYGTEEVFDLSVNHDNHRYYTNDICSHNTGKSLFLQNMCLNWSLMGLNVIYLTLELSEILISLRMDAMVAETSTKNVIKDTDSVAMKILSVARGDKTPVKPGKIQVKKMSEAGTTVNDIRSYIKEFELQSGVKVDALCVDYLDLLYPNSKKVDINSSFTKDKYTSEELRSLAAELNILCVSASQLNRCLSGETIVYQEHNLFTAPKGKRKEDTFKQVKLKDVKINDWVLGQGDFVKVTNVFAQGKQLTYKITLEDGKEIFATSNHRFPSNTGLRSIDTGLKVGMKLDVFQQYWNADTHWKTREAITSEYKEITSIEEQGYEETYDIEVESETHLFYANGILTHNSSVQESDYDISHIAGGISKINTADNVIAIMTSSALREHGEYQLQFLKTRSSNGVGQKLYLSFDKESLRITDKIDPSTDSTKSIPTAFTALVKKNKTEELDSPKEVAKEDIKEEIVEETNEPSQEEKDKEHVKSVIERLSKK